MTPNQNDFLPTLQRIADALDRIAPPLPTITASTASNVFVWHGDRRTLEAVEAPRRVPLSLLLGADDQKARLEANTVRFAQGLPANHALLWGARGTGKSALVKAVHGAVASEQPQLKLIEIGRGDLGSLGQLADLLAAEKWRAILFIDDLSFERGDESYKALKSVLDGGVSSALSGLLVYVTSNRRHLVNRPDGSQADFRPDETVEEQVALPERFGLWLGFHGIDQPTWLAIVKGYASALKLNPKDPKLERTALQWAAQRGARSGRSAWQFIVDRAGELGRQISF